MTIDASQLKSRYGAIYSPPTPGPIFCSFYLVANRDMRIRMQLYRLQGIGVYNNQSKRCVGGFLQIIDGVRALRGNSSAVHVFCGLDIRFERPVTIFKDRAIAVVQYWTESSIKSRFMLQYFFEDKSEESSWQLGGSAIPNAECDWIYRQHNCTNSEEPCEFSSPGYPGLYPNFQHCRYFFRSTDPALQIRIQFKSFDLPAGSCDTHYLNIFDGPYSARTDPALQTLCGETKLDDLVFFSTGPSMVVEFISGSLPPPYNYIGFSATVLFGNNPHDRNTIGSKVDRSFCDWIFCSNSTPSARFGTPMDWYPKNLLCTFRFIPSVQSERAVVTLFSYFLESDHCGTFVEIHELGQADRGGRLLKKICGPISKYAAVGDHKSLEQYAAGPGRTLLVSFVSKSGNHVLGKTSEWLSGHFEFHNDRLLGTKILNTVCDTSFNDQDHQVSGSFSGPKIDFDSDQQLWLTSAPSDCDFILESNRNRSVSVTVQHATLIRPGEETTFWLCKTVCDRAGCACQMEGTDQKQILNDVFHVSFYSRTQPATLLSCLCGDLSEVLPITLSATNGIVQKFHRLAQTTAESDVYGFEAKYNFHEKIYECAKSSRSHAQGALYIATKRNVSQANTFHHLQLNNISPKNTVKLFTSVSQRDKGKGIELCQNNAVTINSSKLVIRLTATGRHLRHRIFWKEVDPAGVDSAGGKIPSAIGSRMRNGMVNAFPVVLALLWTLWSHHCRLHA
ncbi:hypothetical protein BV898_08132 [Hypsibius exemplaris]|uniref:CUB domain-containing protein n=1 Tax=Hypsibius exemplaris TaxID=2072580 RepID=A0A1W0WRL5_HYPEX|nr:hypothetical protein BV898_08132 [Hypsibius exemplaris]